MTQVLKEKIIPLPETMTLYHSTPVENIESILKFGITLSKYDTESRLKEIEASNAVEWKKKSAKDRLLESFRNGHTVCLSGDREYSIQNGNACNEWKNLLDGKAYYGKVAVFKIKIPYRMLEILTVKSWRSTMKRFEELWTSGYFSDNAIECFNSARTATIEEYRRCWMKLADCFTHYNIWPVTHIPPEYIKEYEIVDQKRTRK